MTRIISCPLVAIALWKSPILPQLIYLLRASGRLLAQWPSSFCIGRIYSCFILRQVCNWLFLKDLWVVFSPCHISTVNMRIVRSTDSVTMDSVLESCFLQLCLITFAPRKEENALWVKGEHNFNTNSRWLMDVQSDAKVLLRKPIWISNKKTPLVMYYFLRLQWDQKEKT